MRRHVVSKDDESLSACGQLLELGIETFESRRQAMDAIRNEAHVLPCRACMDNMRPRKIGRG